MTEIIKFPGEIKNETTVISEPKMFIKSTQQESSLSHAIVVLKIVKNNLSLCTKTCLYIYLFRLLKVIPQL